MPHAKVALGWHIQQTKNAQRLLWHNGGTGGFRSFLAFNEQAQQSVVVLSNAENPVDDIGFHILDSAYPLSRFDYKEIELDANILEAYVGDYKLSSRLTLSVFMEGGGLVTQASGQEKVEIFPETAKFFFVKEFDAQLTFEKNEQGAITGLTLHQHGRKTFAPKILSA